MTLLTQPPENVKISFMHRISDAPIHFPSFKVATGNHSDFGVATSKTPCLQELSAIGSHSSHVTTGILFIWEKFKIVLPDSYLFPIYVHVWLQNSGYCGYRGYLHDSLYRWFTIVINVYADMREGLLRDFLFQAHADPESVDKSCRSCSQHRSFTVSMIVFTRSTGRPCSRRFRFSLYCRTA